MASSENNESSIKKQIDDVGEYVDNIGKGLRAAYGRKASRVYNIFTNEFKPNVAGNLRGQIQDKAARIMHGRMSLAVERIEKALIVVSFVDNVIKFEPRFEDIAHSNIPWAAKDVQYAGLVSNALLKAGFTALLSDAETIISVTQLGLHRISAARGGGTGAKMANTVAQSIDTGDKWLKKTVDDIFDPSKQALLARYIIDNVAR